MGRKAWFEKGLRFQCTQCGNCCRSHGDATHVYLAEADLQAIAAHLGLTRAELLARHCEREGGWIQLARSEQACGFLGADNRCTIYPVRPKQCRTWPFWVENLERARWEGPVRETCPGIGQGPLHPADEIRRIARENEAWYRAPYQEELEAEPGGGD